MINTKLNEIIYSLNGCLSDDSGLLSGLAGETIFFAYLYLHSKEDKYKEKARSLVDDLLKKFEEDKIGLAHCSGISGIAWSINHLIDLKIIEADSRIMFFDINQYILKFAKRDLSFGNWDFLHGALGVVAYIIDLPYYKDYQNELEGLIQLLYEQGEKPSEKTIRWKAFNVTPEKEKEYSYGLSHGAPSILAIVIKCYKKGIHRKLSKKIARFILNDMLLEVFENKKECYFPGVINSKGERSNTRLSWCYGDLSIAIILFQFSETFKDKKTLKLANEVALHTTNRPIYTPSITDAGICHGAIGNAYMFSILYQKTKNKIFITVANKWLERGLEMGNHKTGLAGFRILTNKLGQSSFETETGILEGISGIGLCLIHFINPELRSDWNKFLLLS